MLTEKLISQHGFGAVALEADFGGGRVADAYVRGGVGTAEEAAAALGFAIYRNDDMVALLRMLREHNVRLPPEQQVAFYGIDFQRVELNRQQADAYLRPLDPALADELATALQDLDDDTLSSTSRQTYKEAAPVVQSVLERFQARRDEFVARTDQESWELTEQDLRVLSQLTQMQSTGFSQPTRDTFMAANLTWMVDRQAAAGRDGVVLLAHHGHVSRVPTGLSSGTWSGVILAQEYGERYVAIGTDGRRMGFNDGNGTTATVTMRQPYRGVFEGRRLGYVDFTTLSAQNRALMQDQQPMLSVGARWAGWMRLVPPLYVIRVAPAQAYDALVYVDEGTSTEIWD